MRVYVSASVCWKPCIHTSVSIVILHGSFQCFPSCLRLPSLTVRKAPPILHKIFIWPSVLLPSVTADPSLRFWRPLPGASHAPAALSLHHSTWAGLLRLSHQHLPSCPQPVVLIKSFSFPVCLCRVCVSVLCAYLCLLLHVCLLPDGEPGPGSMLSRSALGSEWKEPSWTRWGVPSEPHGGVGDCIFKANRPGLQRSIAGGWACDPSDGVGTASVVRDHQPSLPTGWLLSSSSLPVCELFWNRFNESWCNSTYWV